MHIPTWMLVLQGVPIGDGDLFDRWEEEYEQWEPTN